MPLPVQAGEVVLLHNQLWHRSGPSREGQRRRGFSICYMSDTTRCLRKKHTPRAFFPVFAERPGPCCRRTEGWSGELHLRRAGLSRGAPAAAASSPQKTGIAPATVTSAPDV